MNRLESRPSGVEQHIQVKTESFFNTDMQQIARLQKKFDDGIGKEGNGKEAIKSYNPVLARWTYEKISDPLKKEAFKRYEVFQMKTNLRERHGAAQSEVVYTSDAFGNAYNELFPDEPFDDILMRGIVHRKKEGSPELEREERELHGFIQIRKKLLDINTPLGTKYISVSPPGIVEGTTYTDNFVDIFESVVDTNTGKRAMKMTRNTSDMKYGEYHNAALSVQPDYFDNASGPIDAWFLGNPLYIDPSKDTRSADELFVELFKKRADATKEEDMQQIIQACVPLIMYYIDVLCRETFDPQEIALAFNAILVKGDQASHTLGRQRENNYSVAQGQSEIHRRGVIFSSISQEAAFLGRQKSEDRQVGCGLSGSIEIRGKGVFGSSTFSNSVAKFAFGSSSTESRKDYKDDQNLCKCGGKDAHFHCPGEKNGEKCKHPIVVGKGTKTCPSCGAGKTC